MSPLFNTKNPPRPLCPQTDCLDSCPPADKVTDGMWRFSDPNKQAGASWCVLKTRPPSLFPSCTVIFLEDISAWEESLLERWPQWCLARTKVEKHKWKRGALLPPWHPQLSPSASHLFSSCLFSPLFLFFIHSFTLRCYYFSLFLASPPSLPPSLASCASSTSFPIPSSSSLSAFLHVSLATVPFPQLA